MADIFGGGGLLAAPTPQAPQGPATTNIFSDSNLDIDCSVQRGGAMGEYNIKAFFSNKTMSQLSGVTLQVAV